MSRTKEALPEDYFDQQEQDAGWQDFELWHAFCTIKPHLPHELLMAVEQALGFADMPKPKQHVFVPRDGEELSF